MENTYKKYNRHFCRTANSNNVWRKDSLNIHWETAISAISTISAISALSAISAISTISVISALFAIYAIPAIHLVCVIRTVVILQLVSENWCCL